MPLSGLSLNTRRPIDPSSCLWRFVAAVFLPHTRFSCAPIVFTHVARGVPWSRSELLVVGCVRAQPRRNASKPLEALGWTRVSGGGASAIHCVSELRDEVGDVVASRHELTESCCSMVFFVFFWWVCVGRSSGVCVVMQCDACHHGKATSQPD